MNAHYFDAYAKQSRCASIESRWFGYTIVLLIQGYAYQRWLACSLAWLVACVISLLSVLPLQRHWGRKGLFSDGHRRVVQQGKIIIMMVCCLQYLVLMYNHIASSTSGPSLRIAFQHYPSKLISISLKLCSLLLFMHNSHTHYYPLWICLPVVPCEHDWCAFNSYAHQKRITTSFMWKCF